MTARSEVYASITGTIEEQINGEDQRYIRIEIDQELPVLGAESQYWWFRTRGPYSDTSPSRLVLWLWFGKQAWHRGDNGEYEAESSREPDLEIILDPIQMQRLLELDAPNKQVCVRGPSGHEAGYGRPARSLIENALAAGE